jgi:nucleoside-diphosphate-sugar epimerase
MDRVLVTGGTGFIGSHIAPKLVQDGYDVYVLERYVTGRYELGKSREIKTVFGDLRDAFKIRKIIRDIQPDKVIHTAAISPVSYSYDHPQEVIETNLIGTVNLAESCLHECPNFKHFLFGSTSETYGNGPIPKTEETLQNPNSPYAVSKLTSEKYLKYLDLAFDFPVTILRNFNTYGRTDNTHFVVERIITQMLTKQTVNLGDPKTVRDLVYIDDHVGAYTTCLENPKAIGETFNFCTGKGISIKQLADLIAEIIGFKGEIFWGTIPERPLDIQELVGDFSKANRLLGWKPQYQLKEGLKRTINFWNDKLKTKVIKQTG